MFFNLVKAHHFQAIGFRLALSTRCYTLHSGSTGPSFLYGPGEGHDPDFWKNNPDVTQFKYREILPGAGISAVNCDEVGSAHARSTHAQPTPA